MAPERRDVLRASGGLAALLTGLAGCTEQLSDVTDGGSGSDAPAYATALFDPAAVFDVQTRSFVSVDASAYRQQKAALPESFRKGVEDTAGDVEGAAPSDADRLSGVVGTDRGEPRKYQDDRSVYAGYLTGDFDAERIRSQLAENEQLTERGEYEGFTLYGGAAEYDKTRTVAAAISADALAGATVDVAYPGETPTSGGDYRGGGELTATPSGVPTALDAVKTQVDTAGGGGSPLADDDLVGEILTDLGDAPFIAGTLASGETVRSMYFGDGQGGTREPDDELARDVKALTQGIVGVGGSGTAPESTSSEVTVRLYYDDEGVVSDRAETLRSAIETAKSRSEDVTPPETEVTADGRAVVLIITGDPQRLADEFGFGEASGGGSARGTPAEAPQVAFGFEQNAEGTVTIQHEGGDTVNVDLRVRYTSDGQTKVDTWTAGGDGIAAGDSFTTYAAVDSGSEVTVIWEGDGAAAVLAQFEAP
jgi:hypothetical protein